MDFENQIMWGNGWDIDEADPDDLRRFLIRSGVRENCFCVKNLPYQMPEPIPLEAWERAVLRDADYC